jgi:hypothetical protein
VTVNFPSLIDLREAQTGSVTVVKVALTSLGFVLKPPPAISCTCEHIITASIELIMSARKAFTGSAPLMGGQETTNVQATVYTSSTYRGLSKA